MKHEEKAFMVFLLVLVVTMTILSFGFSKGSRMLPMIGGIVSSVLLIFLVIMSVSSGAFSWYSRLETKASIDTEPRGRQEKKKEMAIVAWFVGGLAAIYLAGFIIAIPMFLFMFLRFSAKEGWLVSLVVPGVVTAIVYFAFVSILSVPLYAGLLFE